MVQRLNHDGSDDKVFPRILISLIDFQRIKCFVDLCPFEINGFGWVEQTEAGFFIRDTFILRQFTSPNGDRVTTSSKALNDFVRELVEKGADPAEIKFQWHSHGDMPVFFSPEDEETINSYLNEFMISLVMNKLGEYLCRLDLFQPFRWTWENLPLFVVIPAPADALREQCLKEIKEKVVVRRAARVGLRRTKSDGQPILVEASHLLTEGDEASGPQKTT